MAVAGFEPVTRHLPSMARRPARDAPRVLFEHRCPVCQFSRTARRKVSAWRCAECSTAGLDGQLVITPVRPTRSH